ncbi:interleukin-9 [Cervus elaphus]|uniref:interleukin-9 n=1 Tax=Cervus elaphus TaxID=9860 RepID=UPI001CC322DB|nr:interleukin-9 [Cervus elaphus]
MLLAVVLASSLFLCASARPGCFTPLTFFTGIKNVEYLINNLQETDCLCLPISSDNCTTACFQEGLSQMSNSAMTKRFHLNVNQLKKIVVTLKSNKCGSFACEQPCNQTTRGNTVTFLKTLLQSLQSERMRDNV